MKHVTLIVCVPTSINTEIIPGSTQRQCEECKCGIWLAPSSIRDMPDQQGGISLRCVACAVQTLNAAKAKGIPCDTVPVTENQKADLAAMHDRFSARSYP